MQEAVDEIVTMLTEEQFRGKMVVIFAGYASAQTARVCPIASTIAPTIAATLATSTVTIAAHLSRRSVTIV
jgi:hypothetical protein